MLTLEIIKSKIFAGILILCLLLTACGQTAQSTQIQSQPIKPESSATPLLLPFVLLAVQVGRGGMARFDYLIPAELFPSALLGGLLLLWAALRARSRLKIIGWSFGVAAGLLIAGQAFAVLSGLASGEAEPAGWLLPVAITVIIVYILALLALAVGGILLLRDLFRKP